MQFSEMSTKEKAFFLLTLFHDLVEMIHDQLFEQVNSEEPILKWEIRAYVAAVATTALGVRGDIEAQDLIRELILDHGEEIKNKQVEMEKEGNWFFGNKRDITQEMFNSIYDYFDLLNDLIAKNDPIDKIANSMDRLFARKVSPYQAIDASGTFISLGEAFKAFD